MNLFYRQLNVSFRRSPSECLLRGSASRNMSNYIVSYDGPANLSTVSDWMVNQVQKNNWNPNDMIDMIIILGKGILWKLAAFPELKLPKATENNFWAFIDQPQKNLFTLFVHMLTWVVASSTPPNTLSYVSKVTYQNIQIV